MTLRPDIVKLDRSVVAGIAEDEAKRALVETVGALAGRLDAWILAEGIETPRELDALVGLGVPLGQGYLLGRPGSSYASAPATVSGRIRDASVPLRSAGTVAPLVELAPSVTTDRSDEERTALFVGGAEVVAVVDADDVVVDLLIEPGTRIRSVGEVWSASSPGWRPSSKKEIDHEAVRLW